MRMVFVHRSNERPPAAVPVHLGNEVVKTLPLYAVPLNRAGADAPPGTNIRQETQ